MSCLKPVFIVMVASMLALPGCGASPTSPGELPLLRVLRISQMPLDLTLGAVLRCQVTMDVQVVLPDCTGFGHIDSSIEGNTYRYELRGSRATRCTGQVTDSLQLCIGPGIESPGRLPPGDYSVVVNGVSGSFLIR